MGGPAVPLGPKWFKPIEGEFMKSVIKTLLAVGSLAVASPVVLAESHAGAADEMGTCTVKGKTSNTTKTACEKKKGTWKKAAEAAAGGHTAPADHAPAGHEGDHKAE